MIVAKYLLFATQLKLNTMKIYATIIFASLISSILAQTDQQFDGACPTVTTLKSLNKAQYVGQWYEIKRFANTLIPGECGSADYYEQTTHGYNITYTSRDIPNKKTSEIRILIEKEVLNSPFSKYDVYYDCERNKISHYILDTDYTTYSIVWGCSETTEGTEDAIRNTQRLFIYSREKTLDQATIDKAIEVLKKFNIEHTQLKDVEQDDEKCGRNEEEPTVKFSKFN